MAAERLLLRDAIGGFAPGQGFRAVLLLTFSFDGRWLEEGLVPDLFDRQVNASLVIRDGNALIQDSPSVRYHRANAQFSTRVFHSKLVLLVADDRALAVIGSANLTRGGLERNLELASAYEVSPRRPDFCLPGSCIRLSAGESDHKSSNLGTIYIKPLLSGNFADSIA
jgi:PLD-like domain